MYGRVAPPFQAGYGASKHALHGFFDVLREELRPHGVSVTVHCPGGVATEVTSKFTSGGGDAAHLELPSAFMAPADACARSVLFAADRREAHAYYPAYARGMAFARSVDAESFDWAYHSLVEHYMATGVFELKK